MYLKFQNTTLNGDKVHKPFMYVMCMSHMYMSNTMTISQSKKSMRECATHLTSGLH